MKLKDGFVSLFSSVVFLDYISPFNICCKAGLKLNIQKTMIRASGPITFWQVDGDAMDTVRLSFLGSKITADNDCSHEIKRCFLLGRKAMTNLDSILKSRDVILQTKVHLVRAMVFQVVMYGSDLI